MRNQVWKADEITENQIKRYFEEEKNYINSGHKDFGINFERKAENPGTKSDHHSETQSETLSAGSELNILDDNDEIEFHKSKRNKKTRKTKKTRTTKTKRSINSGYTDSGINVERTTEKSESPKPFELNVLDNNDIIDFYQSKRDMLADLWEDDAIILEASLKHLQIIQDSLSDKLPKIIHYEIFHSTKNFVEEELAEALIDVWKKNKDIMSPNESEKQKIRKLENDIKNYEKALEIINEMMRIIRNFKNQNQFQKFYSL